MQSEEMERLIFFEQTRLEATAKTQSDPKDPQGWLQLGGSLLELAHFRRGAEAHDMLSESIEAFEKVLKLDPNRHEAMWCLGNALTSEGFLGVNRDEAIAKFEKASVFFDQAYRLAPQNEHYKKSMEMAPKAEQIYDQVHAGPEPMMMGGGGPMPPPASSIDQKNDDFFYTCVGWGVLAASIITFAMFAPKPPPLA